MDVVLLSQRTDEPLPCAGCECAPGRCRYRPALVRVYLIAYREAVKCGDDPAEYIRDHVRNSREVDPWTRGGRLIDPQASTDIKLSLELVRARSGIELNLWNADRLSKALCPERWDEGPPEPPR